MCRAYARFKSECFDLKVNTVVLVNMIMATRQTCLYLGVINPNLILCYVKYVKLILCSPVSYLVYDFIFFICLDQMVFLSGSVATADV